jgi:autotransporter-associated beta strand protein
MKNPPRFCAVLPVAAALLTGLHSAVAGDVNKLDNSTALNLGTSWQGGSAPGASDVGVWSGTFVANRITQLGADMSWAGIRVGPTSGAGTLMTISGSLPGSNTLTLGSSGIDMTSAGVNLTINTNLVLGASQSWNVTSGRTLAVQTGTVSGSGALELAGSGTIVMSGNANSYSGGTTLSGGVHVGIGSASASNTPFGSGTLTVQDNAQIFGTSAGSRHIANMVVLNADLTVGTTAVGNSTFQFNGGIDVGSGTRTISVVNAAAPTVSSPGLYISPGGPMGGTGTLVIANGNAAASPEVWVRWGTSGTHQLTSNLTVGSGVTVFFNASNMFSASSALTVDSGGILDLSNKGGAFYTQTIKSLAGGGLVTNTKNTASGIGGLTIDGGVSTGTTTFTGNLLSGTSAGASLFITKTGSTTQIFAGSNSYIGQTQVNAGTLLVNGVHIDSETSSVNGYGSTTNGHYLVASGAVLGGNGRIAGRTTANNSNMILVQSGGTLAPGASIGALKLDGANIGGTNSRVLNMASGADFAFELAGNGSGADQIEFWNYTAGDLLLNSNEINLTLTGPLVAGTYNVTLFEFFGDSGSTLTTSGITGGLTIGTLDPNIVGTPTLSYNSLAGTITLEYTVVPEPGTFALLAGGLGAVLIFRRRRVKM